MVDFALVDYRNAPSEYTITWRPSKPFKYDKCVPTYAREELVEFSYCYLISILFCREVQRNVLKCKTHVKYAVFMLCGCRYFTLICVPQRKHLRCVPFGESKHIQTRDIRYLPDIAAKRNAKPEIGSVTVVILRECV